MPICTPFVDVSAGRITVCTSTTRPTGALLYEGKYIFEANTERTLFWDGTGWVIWSEPAQDHVPTWTNLTVGNGSQTFQYRRSDGWCDYEGRLTFGTTTSVTGLFTLSLPFTAASYISGTMFNGRYLDNSGALYYAAGFTTTTTVLTFLAWNAAAATSVSWSFTGAGSPFTWAVDDTIGVSGRFPLATRYS